MGSRVKAKILTTIAVVRIFLAGAEGIEPSTRGFGVLEFAFGDLW